MTPALPGADAKALRQRERALASRDRENFARFNAVSMQHAFVRRRWRRLLLVWLTSLVATPLALLLRGELRGFLIGVYVTAVGAALAHWVVVASGSASVGMGDQGEQWTRDVVHPLHKSGWKIIHNALLEKRDIDTVLVGPAGIVVLETKWSGAEWSSSFNAALVRDAAFEVRQSARRTRLMVKPRAQVASGHVYSAVVLWGPELPGVLPDEGGVAVMGGPELADWLSSLPDAGVPDAEIAAAAELIGETTVRRDAHETAKRGPRPPTPGELLSRVFQCLYGFCAGALATSLAATAKPAPLAIACMTAVVAVTYLFRRIARVRTFARTAFITSAAVEGVLLGLTIGYWLWATITR